MTASAEKHALRDRSKATLQAITPDQRAQAAQSIAAHLLTDPDIAAADAILAYAALPAELDLDPFIAAALNLGKRVCVPSIDWARKSMSPAQIANVDTDLQTGRYGVRTPKDRCTLVEPEQLDVILLPGLAFDRAGNRLGRGAGFYDRMLAAQSEPPTPPVLIGVCYAAQLTPSVPIEPHDHRAHRVITEQGPA